MKKTKYRRIQIVLIIFYLISISSSLKLDLIDDYIVKVYLGDSKVELKLLVDLTFSLTYILKPYKSNTKKSIAEEHIYNFNNFYGKYEVTTVVPAQFKIRRPLFKDPELIVTQPPELWARCLEVTTRSRSSVNNYQRTESKVPSSVSTNRIYFSKGSAISVLGKLSVVSHPELYVFNSSIAYAADPERVEKFETLTDFEQHYCKPENRHYCIARISRLPILCFPA